MMRHEEYIAEIKYDDDAEIFHGEVINTRDVITFQGASVRALKKEFKNSIEDYLEFCKKRGESPDRPFSGKFNLRIDPEKHKDIVIEATRRGMSINDFCNESLDKNLYDIGKPKVIDKHKR